MDINSIFKNNAEWIARKLQYDSNYFTRLSEGQQPQVLYIGCSDSRVTAEEIMGLVPGEMFVHRNIANMVSALDLGAMSGIEYAVSFLKVKHIVVCGHYGCGGVKAAMESVDLGILNPWLRNIRDVYRLHKEELDKISDEEQKYHRLVEVNVMEQCTNVIKVAAVQRAYRKGDIAVHGWVFDMNTGKLIDLAINFPKILQGIMEIYRLD